MATINVLVAVDGAKLAEQVADGSIKPGTAESPTYLGAYSSSNVYISMIAPDSYVDNGTNGQSELQIKANGGDTVEWAMTTFDNNFDQTAYIYGGTFSPEGSINIPLSYASGEAHAYLGTGNPASTSPTQFTNQVSTVSGTVLKLDLKITYHLKFILVDNSNGKVIGYFWWDPFINVN